jgi:hypothetical protein
VLRLQIELAEQLSAHPETVRDAEALLSSTADEIGMQLQNVCLDQRRGDLIGQWIRLYGLLIRLLTKPEYGLHAGDDFRQSLVKAFDFHEFAKARSFASSLANADMLAPASVPEVLLDEERELLAREREYQAEHHVDLHQREHVRLERLTEIRSALEECWAKMERHAADYVKLRRAESADHEDAKVLVKNGHTALVSAFIDRQEVVWFVQRPDDDELRVFRSRVDANTLLEAAKLLRREFNGAPLEFPPYPPIRRAEPQRRCLDFFEKWSAELLAFLPGVAGVEHVCVAPHGPLHLLPLHALRTPEGDYLAEKLAVTYVPSISSLRYCMSYRDGRADRHEAIGSVYCAGVAAREDARPELFEQEYAIFGEYGFGQVVAEFGINAAKASVLRGIRGHAVVHLTCHGFYEEQDPLSSGLLFSNGRERPPRNSHQIPYLERPDFILYARDLLSTPMNAELVVLRACSTGLQAERNSGDEFDGFSRTLLQAGNATVLVNLWNVDRESSQRFITRFYGHWKNRVSPMPKWRAFWLAQKEFIQEQDETFLRHPYHWAPMVMIGDWR